MTESIPNPMRAQWRADLLSRRAALPDRAVRDARLIAQLQQWLARQPARCIGFYWPIRGEIDLRGAITAWLAQDPARRAALPVVVARNAPLAFRLWQPDAKMVEGAFGVPVPDGTAACVPELLLAPCVGFSVEADGRTYRLGYGGGFYDRTLAALSPVPATLGVAHDAARLATLAPAPHDRPLDAVITESGVIGL